MQTPPGTVEAVWVQRQCHDESPPHCPIVMDDDGVFNTFRPLAARDKRPEIVKDNVWVKRPRLSLKLSLIVDPPGLVYGGILRSLDLA